MKGFVLMLGIILIAGCTTQSEIANPSAVYCEEQGYTYEIRNTPEGQNGFCVFPDGSECEGWAYYNGNCSIGTASTCSDSCGDGVCAEVVCQSIGCPCAETAESCPSDCA